MPAPTLRDRVLRGYESLRTGAVAFPLDEHALLELTGEDRLEWLQGQVTDDVRGLTEGKNRSFCFVEPTGQLLAVVDAWALEDRILMVTSRGCVDAVLERVERMTILEDVSTRALSPALSGFSIQGPEATEPTSGLVLKSDRTGRGGWDVWGTPPVIEAVASLVPEVARIEAGIPKWGVDMGPRTLPAELGPAFEARHVDYDKGCYTGQEILMRMHSRGHTNRTWVGLLGAEPMAAGAEVVSGEGIVGRVSSVAVSPQFGPIAAATLRNEATAEGTRVTVGGVEAEVREMPILRAA